MTEALKPCPFCGGEAIEHRGSFLGGNGFWVSCAGRDCRVVPRSKAVTAEDATTRWNARALPSPATDAGEVRTEEAVDREMPADDEIRLLREALTIYGDRVRMATSCRPDLQQVIDIAFEATAPARLKETAAAIRGLAR